MTTTAAANWNRPGLCVGIIDQAGNATAGQGEAMNVNIGTNENPLTNRGRPNEHE